LNLLHTQSLVNNLSDSTLIIDSTALIDASKSEDFLKLLTDIAKAGCAFVTINAVIHEFTRGAKDIAQLNKQIQVINGLGIIVYPRLEDKIDKKDQVFLFAYNKTTIGNRSEKGPSYIDSLLCLLAYKFKHTGIKILSANHKDIPLSIFNRDELITMDISGELRTEAIYSFSEDKFKPLIDDI